jgi:hypothetical protein
MWLYWNDNLDIPNDGKDDCEADVKSDIVPDNGIEDLESSDPQDVSDAPDVPQLIRPTLRSRSHLKKVLTMVNAMETRKKTRFKIILDTVHQCFTSILCSLTEIDR